MHVAMATVRIPNVHSDTSFSNSVQNPFQHLFTHSLSERSLISSMIPDPLSACQILILLKCCSGPHRPLFNVWPQSPMSEGVKLNRELKAEASMPQSSSNDYIVVFDDISSTCCRQKPSKVESAVSLPRRSRNWGRATAQSSMPYPLVDWYSESMTLLLLSWINDAL